MHGKNFITHPEIHYPDLLEVIMILKEMLREDGFENQKLFMIRYTKDYQVSWSMKISLISKGKSINLT